MKSKFAVRAVAVAVFALGTCVMPQVVLAQTAASNCSDSTVQQNRQKYQQELSQAGHNINAATPVIPAFNQCQQNLLGIMQTLPKLSDPMSLAGAAVQGIIGKLGSVAGAVCSKMMPTNMLSKLSPQMLLTMGGGSSGGGSSNGSTLSQMCTSLPTFNGMYDATTAASISGITAPPCGALAASVGSSLTSPSGN